MDSSGVAWTSFCRGACDEWEHDVWDTSITLQGIHAGTEEGGITSAFCVQCSYPTGLGLCLTCWGELPRSCVNCDVDLPTVWYDILCMPCAEVEGSDYMADVQARKERSAYLRACEECEHLTYPDAGPLCPICRFGREEFGLVLPHRSDLREVQRSTGIPVLITSTMYKGTCITPATISLHLSHGDRPTGTHCTSVWQGDGAVHWCLHMCASMCTTPNVHRDRPSAYPCLHRRTVLPRPAPWCGVQLVAIRGNVAIHGVVLL